MCGRPHPLALPHRLYVLLQLSTIFRVVALYHPQLQVRQGRGQQGCPLGLPALLVALGCSMRLQLPSNRSG